MTSSAQSLHFNDFYRHITQGPLSDWLTCLPAQLKEWLHTQASLNKGNAKWYTALEHIPALTPDHLDLKNSVTAQLSSPLSEGEKAGMTYHLKQLMPWRKGPYNLYDIFIDTEWRSDWKWDRLLPHISPLKNKYVLDVGCGSGYHMWRMLGEGANTVVGIDPTELFFCQFNAVKKLIGKDLPAFMLPLGIEALPELNAFDTVFSMGVLYHRRSPLDHLIQLKNQLVSGGELVLETLIVEGDEQHVLLPEDRYAQMGNVYFIPSTKALISWLKKCGFINIRLVDSNITSIEEQRATDWMQGESLVNYLDPIDRTKTIEGYPAPLRAVIIANKP